MLPFLGFWSAPLHQGRGAALQHDPVPEGESLGAGGSLSFALCSDLCIYFLNTDLNIDLYYDLNVAPR